MKENFIGFHENVSEQILDNEIYYLNDGGCGFYAYFMSKKLAMLGYKPEILVLTSNNQRITHKYHLLDKIKNNQSVEVPQNSLSASHFVVKCGNYIFDSYRIIDLSGTPPLREGYDVIFEYKYIGKYTIEDMAIALYRDAGGWNSCYDRFCNNTLYNVIKKVPILSH